MIFESIKLPFIYFFLRKALKNYFSEYKACYVDDKIFNEEIDILTAFIIRHMFFYNESLVNEYMCKHRRYKKISDSYFQALKDEKLGHTVFARVCCGCGKYESQEKIYETHISDECAENTEKLIWKIVNNSDFSDRQKFFLWLSFVSAMMLLVSMIERFDNGYYTFLRIITCISLTGLCFENLAMWLKFCLILLAILYNPLVQIHMGRNDWEGWNILTILAFILVCGGIIARKKFFIGKYETWH